MRGRTYAPHAHDFSLGVEGLKVAREVLAASTLGLGEFSASTSSCHIGGCLRELGKRLSRVRL
jgi:hypothetical protein